jgi:hypothetical protein
VPRQAEGGEQLRVGEGRDAVDTRAGEGEYLQVGVVARCALPTGTKSMVSR